jgi:Chitobiase/beta-hexosaminidase C-terminal domain/Bacterial Ig domain
MRDVASDTTAPVSSIACNGSACSSTAYTAPVSVSLSATDAGSRADVIRYTLNGSDPTASSPSYSGPFTVSATTNYRAWDTAGNVEATKTQRIQMDTVAPTVVITSSANGATVNGNIKVVASPADPNSGIASVALAFYLDGTRLGHGDQRAVADPIYRVVIVLNRSAGIEPASGSAPAAYTRPSGRGGPGNG